MPSIARNWSTGIRYGTQSWDFEQNFTITCGPDIWLCDMIYTCTCTVRCINYEKNPYVAVMNMYMYISYKHYKRMLTYQGIGIFFYFQMKNEICLQSHFYRSFRNTGWQFIHCDRLQTNDYRYLLLSFANFFCPSIQRVPKVHDFLSFRKRNR
jgi:hypothetical protein